MIERINVRPRNWVVPVALVSLREESSYGYELMERLAKFGFEEINSGTLYRTLRQMEKERLCQSEWETVHGGPARRMYSLTETGGAYLNSWYQAYKQYQKLLDAFATAYTANGYLHHSEGEEGS